MTDRADKVRVAAARLVVIATTSLVGLSVIIALGMMLVRFATRPGYFPSGWFNTLLTFGMVIAGLLTLRHLDTSWRRVFILYNLFLIATCAAMVALEYRLYVVQLQVPLSFEPNLYLPHLSILSVALIVGFKASWPVSGAAVAYLVWMGVLQADMESMGPPIFVALAIPFVAVLVERLLDEVERESRRAYQAETSIGIMAHDLGSPLTVLSASLEMLEEKSTPSEQRETIMRAIRRNTKTLRLLLDEFREIPYLDEALPMETINLRSLVNDVVELYARPMCEKRGQTLCADLDFVEVFGIPSRLSRLARELLTNAMKYTPRDGRIEVMLQVKDRAMFRVSDNGWGIKKEELDYVFEPHWRGAAALQGNVSGTGLGLYICKNIVEDHGGHVEVESQPGGGTSFTVYLPLPEPATTPLSPDASPTPKGDMARPRIFPLDMHKKESKA